MTTRKAQPLSAVSRSATDNLSRNKRGRARMTSRNPHAASMFESLAILHLCSQPEVQDTCSDRLRAAVLRIAGLRGAEFSDFLSFADVQRTQVRTLDILTSV